MSLEYALLGPLEVRRDGLPIALTRPRERALLTLLLLAEGRPVPAEVLIENLWAGEPPPNAASALRSYLSRLRGRLSLGDEDLANTPGGYRLRDPGTALDIRRFTDLLTQGQQARAAGRHREEASLLRTALRLWRGEALTEIADSPIVAPVAFRLVELRLGALEECVEAELAAGGSSALIGELEELTRRHPLRERFWTARMLALHRAGRSGDACTVYRELYQLLDAELGLLPSTDARTLHEAVLRADPALLRPQHAAGVPSPLPQRLAARALDVFYGRTADLAMLIEHWRRSAVSADRVVLISGEPGISKTTMCARFASAVRDDGGAVLYGRCDPELGLPYQPFSEALGQLIRGLTPDEQLKIGAQYGADLAGLVPELAAGAVVRSADPRTERFLLLRAVAQVLRPSAGDAGRVLIVDDLHWADGPTLAMLRYVAASATDGLLIVGTYRAAEATPDSYVGSAVDALRREEGVRDVVLAGLDIDAVTAIVRAETDCADPSLVADLHAQTGGNPFYIREVLRHLREHDLVTADATRRRTAGLPDSLRAAVRGRVARLGPDAERLLSVAAVIGQDFDTDTLERAAATGADRVVEVLTRARAGSLVTEQAAGRFGFTHAVIQHALIEALGPTALTLTHRQVADSIEQMVGAGPGPRSAELARHRLAAARSPEEAAATQHYAQAAGDAAAAALAAEEAAEWYGRALELLSAAAGAVERIDLLTARGQAQLMSGDPTHRATLLEACALAKSAGQDDRLVHAAIANNRGTFTRSGAVDLDRVGVLRAACDVVAPDTPQAARLKSILAAELTFDDDARIERHALAEHALQLARRLKDPELLVAVATVNYLATWVPENLFERLALTAEIVALADALGDPFRRHWAHRMRIQALMDSGDLDGVDHHIDVLADAATSSGDPHQAWSVAFIRSWQVLIAGDLTGAERWADTALQIGLARGQDEAELIFALQLWAVRRQQGRAAEMVDMLAGAVAADPQAAFARGALALACCEAGQLPRAAELLAAEATDGFTRIGHDFCRLPTLCDFADAAAQANHVSSARTLYQLLEPWADQIAGVHGCLAAGPVPLHLGSLAIALDEPARAEAHFRAALTRQDVIAAPYWGGRAQLGLAGALRQQGRDRDSAEIHDLIRLTAESAHEHELGALSNAVAAFGPPRLAES